MSYLTVWICTILISIVQVNSSCTYWCRKPLSFEYTCCDVIRGSSSTDSPVPEDITQITKVIAQPKRPPTCRYFCVYGEDKVYCCDDGSSPLPANHNDHDGRCPFKKEQVCKKGGIFLHVHASKLTTKTGEKQLSKKTGREEHPDCASDGYCLNDEKCCENICAKKHTCLKAVYDYDGGIDATVTVQKKKKRRN